VFSTTYRLANLTPFSRPSPPFLYPTRHRVSLVDPCMFGVVYEVPLSCGARYIGETGRCMTLRLREHTKYVKDKSESSHIYHHLRGCQDCVVHFDGTRVLSKVEDRFDRMLIEAYYIYCKNR